MSADTDIPTQADTAAIAALVMSVVMAIADKILRNSGPGDQDEI
jgi:hypothetical protein